MPLESFEDIIDYARQAGVYSDLSDFPLPDELDISDDPHDVKESLSISKPVAIAYSQSIKPSEPRNHPLKAHKSRKLPLLMPYQSDDFDWFPLSDAVPETTMSVPETSMSVPETSLSEILSVTRATAILFKESTQHVKPVLGKIPRMKLDEPLEKTSIPVIDLTNDDSEYEGTSLIDTIESATTLVIETPAIAKVKRRKIEYPVCLEGAAGDWRPGLDSTLSGHGKTVNVSILKEKIGGEFMLTVPSITDGIENSPGSVEVEEWQLTEPSRRDWMEEHLSGDEKVEQEYHTTELQNESTTNVVYNATSLEENLSELHDLVQSTRIIATAEPSNQSIPDVLQFSRYFMSSPSLTPEPELEPSPPVQELATTSTTIQEEIPQMDGIAIVANSSLLTPHQITELAATGLNIVDQELGKSSRCAIYFSFFAACKFYYYSQIGQVDLQNNMLVVADAAEIRRGVQHLTIVVIVDPETTVDQGNVSKISKIAEVVLIEKRQLLHTVCELARKHQGPLPPEIPELEGDSGIEFLIKSLGLNPLSSTVVLMEMTVAEFVSMTDEDRTVLYADIIPKHTLHSIAEIISTNPRLLT